MRDSIKKNYLEIIPPSHVKKPVISFILRTDDPFCFHSTIIFKIYLIRPTSIQKMENSGWAPFPGHLGDPPPVGGVGLSACSDGLRGRLPQSGVGLPPVATSSKSPLAIFGTSSLGGCLTRDLRECGAARPYRFYPYRGEGAFHIQCRLWNAG